MSGRDVDEEHRVSSPLELLFDLTFVVAVAQVASQLARTIMEGKLVTDGLAPYLMIFFAIWLAWLNFTWFASAYDTDDVFYRLLTMVQMAGVLVLAAGVPEGFTHGNFTAVTVGYIIMRVALVIQWLRAARENPEGRATALRYAGGIVIVQIGWILRLFLPAEFLIEGFAVLAAAELVVPLGAERTGLTPWHPHHIAERYGLFTIILLGESVSATMLATQGFLESDGLSVHLIVVAGAGLVLIFALWWLYFKEPSAEGLSQHRDRSFVWGYGHYLLFASVAAVGAAIEVAVESGSEHSEISPIVVGYALAIPVAIFFAALWALHLQIVDVAVIPPVALWAGAVAVLLVPLAASAIGVAGVVAAIALIAALLVAATVAAHARTHP
ncbi:low temperature requirement protein A [soil metagenome]